MSQFVAPPGQPHKWTEADRQRVIRYMASWPLAKLREHQHFLKIQLRMAAELPDIQRRDSWRIEGVLRLQAMEEITTAAVDLREFGPKYLRVRSHRARNKLETLLGQPPEWVFGSIYRIPRDLFEQARRIKGVTGVRNIQAELDKPSAPFRGGFATHLGAGVPASAVEGRDGPGKGLPGAAKES